MKSSFNFLAIFLLSITTIRVYAKSASFSHYNLTVVYGDHKSEFQLDRSSSGAFLGYFSSVRGSKKEKLSLKNYNFIHQIAASTLALKNNEKIYCSRKFIELKGTFEGKAIEKLACIGSRTKISEKMTELANTLDLQIY